MDNDKLKSTLEECQKRDKKRAVLLSDILENVEYENVDDLGRDILKYLRDTEKDFIYSKLLHVFEQESEEELKEDMKRELYGASDYFPASLSYKNNMYVFTLPPMVSVKRDNRHNPNGKYIKYLTLSLLEETDIPIRTLKKPVIMFEHHICVNGENELPYVADADNIDAKSCQDALQKFLFNDDNLLSLTTVHRGVKDDRAFTKVMVMDEYIFRKNISEKIIFA